MQEGPYVVFQVTAVTTQERFLFKKNFFGPEKCSFYSREVTKRERLLMKQVRYIYSYAGQHVDSAPKGRRKGQRKGRGQGQMLGFEILCQNPQLLSYYRARSSYLIIEPIAPILLQNPQLLFDYKIHNSYFHFSRASELCLTLVL